MSLGKSEDPRLPQFLFRGTNLGVAAMHYYQFNIGDYQSHTAHLEPLEDLAYRRMLDWCYLHERPLPEDIDQISKLIRMRSHSDCIANVLQEFFDRTPEGWWKDRIGKEIEKTGEKSRKASESAKARWSKGKVDANALPAQSERNATQDTEHITQDTKKKAAAAAVVCPADVDQQVWVDFVAVRKAKKAPVTASAIAGIAVEAEKAGWTLDQALREITARGWQGFKASWVKETLSVAEQRLQTMHQLTGGITTPKSMPNFWDKPVINEAKEISDVERKRLL